MCVSNKRAKERKIRLPIFCRSGRGTYLKGLLNGLDPNIIRNSRTFTMIRMRSSLFDIPILTKCGTTYLSIRSYSSGFNRNETIPFSSFHLMFTKCLQNQKSPGNWVKFPGKRPFFGRICRSGLCLTSCNEICVSRTIFPEYQRISKQPTLKCLHILGNSKMFT